jgi:hypothetical protein
MPGLVLGVILALRGQSVAAQAWDTPAANTLMDRAVARRAQVDSTLKAWTGDGAGTLQFLVELGNSTILPPRVVKLVELASRIRWEAPGFSQQRIIGQRDTMLLPGDVGFYNDRYGVITNNLGDRISLGGTGRDVRDLPHPLSAGGRRGYVFAIVDSLSIAVPGRRVEAYELLLRPRNPEDPGMVGSMYLDRATGDLVRLAVTFTRAAIVDARIEQLSLVLENLLVDGRYWLPYRQELEVVRGSTWFDFPVEGIVRAKWIVSNQEAFADSAVVPPALPTTGRPVAVGTSGRITVAPESEWNAYQWNTPILAALDPTEQALSAAEVQSVQKQAETIVQQSVLDRATHASIGGRGISDFAHVNRVEGLGLGIDGQVGLGGQWRAASRVAYGFSDEQLKGGLELSWRARPALRVSVFGGRAYRDAGDVAEVSGVRNTLAAQILGDDDTDPYDVYAAGIGVRLEPGGALSWDLRLAAERQEGLSVNASPWSGTYGPTIPALDLDAIRLDLTLTRQRDAVGSSGSTLGWRVNGRLEAISPRDESPDALVARVAVSLMYDRPVGAPVLHLETHAGAVGGGNVPSQELIRLGGMVTGPGNSYHAFAARYGISQRAEVRIPVPFIAIPLLTYGKSPARATLAPYGTLVCVTDRVSQAGGSAADGCYPSVGVGFLMLFDFLRFDVAYGFGDGGWRFGVDAGRFLWGIL